MTELPLRKADEKGLRDALAVVRSPKFNTNPVQRLVDEALAETLYPIMTGPIRAERDALAEQVAREQAHCVERQYELSTERDEALAALAERDHEAHVQAQTLAEVAAELDTLAEQVAQAEQRAEQEFAHCTGLSKRVTREARRADAAEAAVARAEKQQAQVRELLHCWRDEALYGLIDDRPIAYWGYERLAAALDEE